MDGIVTVLPNEPVLVAHATSEPAAFAAIYDYLLSITPDVY